MVAVIVAVPAAILSVAVPRTQAFANTAVGATTAPPATYSAPTEPVGTQSAVQTATITFTTAGTPSTIGVYTQGTAPTDTIQVAIDIAQNPTLNVTGIFNLTPPAGPFQPQLSAAPADWTMAVKYKNVGLNAPMTATVDTSGQVWLANSGSNTVTVLAQTGAPLPTSPLSGNSLNGPVAIAIDTSSNAWVANKTDNSISAFTDTGSVLSGSPFNDSGNLNAPTALAFDAPGNLWVGNSASLVELTASGSYISTQSSGTAAPTAIAIDPK